LLVGAPTRRMACIGSSVIPGVNIGANKASSA